MKKLEFLTKMHSLVSSPDKQSLDLSLADTHHEGLFSLVISGTQPGTLTRVFIADSKIKPFEVQLHSHRYPIKLTAIKGNIKHYVAIPTTKKDANTVSISEFEYQSPLNGGSGLKYLKETNVTISDHFIPHGATIEMDETEIHSVSCSKGSIWIVEEQGFETDKSIVLGVPFSTEGLYNKPQMFQINDKCQLVAKELKKIILDYQAVS